ncbi:hypothetical protein MMC09_001438 [Bachmanniomyces sp. S44760]|nr:hypothetical protein [Bachmanniomyces sp. S44760]
MSLPIRSDPVPIKITAKTSSRDVRRYLIDLLQHIDSNITSARAQEMAEKFSGDGVEALELEEVEWELLFGKVHGWLVYKRFARFQDEYVDKDTIWPHLRHVYRIFVVLLLIHSGGIIFERETFTLDSRWILAALVYLIAYGFAYNFTSAKWIDDSPSWPQYRKIRPMGPKQKSWRSTVGCAD